MNFCFIQSLLDQSVNTGVIDVVGNADGGWEPPASTGTPLCANPWMTLPPGGPYQERQLWSFQSGPHSIISALVGETYFIVSQLPVVSGTPPLVVAIDESGTSSAVQLESQKPAYVSARGRSFALPVPNPAAKNQLWTLVQAPANPYLADIWEDNVFFIQSVLRPGFVIEIAGSSQAAGAPLQVNSMQLVTRNNQPMNQLWYLTTNPIPVEGIVGGPQGG
jgi:hypothetical protein